MSLRWQNMNIDSVDPASLARWWADLLGWRITFEEPDEVVLEPPKGSPEDGVSPDMLFTRVPETKQVKNRLHIDLRPDDQTWRSREQRLLVPVESMSARPTQ